MKILVLKEKDSHEKRVALSPEITKKLHAKGVDVFIEKDAGKESGMTDAAYEAAGGKIVQDIKTILKDADIIPHVSPPSLEEVSHFKQGSVLISLLKPHTNKDLLEKLAHHRVTSLCLEMIPRISRAQSMDVLSSQSNLAGYKAVVDAASEYGRAMPLMMTAAGTVAPARVLIIGAGVAGLQAIATARRMGAIVSAFDVRPIAKEQVESLGATFIEVSFEETGEGSGGYAREMSEAYQKRQAEKLAEVIKTQDILITTAQIPGKKAPLLVTTEMVKSMRAGSVIVDLAVETGGNCELSEFGKMSIKHGVKIRGHGNILSRIAQEASQLFSKNIFNLLHILLKEEKPPFTLNMEDEIIKASCLTHKGALVHPHFQ